MSRTSMLQEDKQALLLHPGMYVLLDVGLNRQSFMNANHSRHATAGESAEAVWCCHTGSVVASRHSANCLAGTCPTYGDEQTCDYRSR